MPTASNDVGVQEQSGLSASIPFRSKMTHNELRTSRSLPPSWDPVPPSASVQRCARNRARFPIVPRCQRPGVPLLNFAVSRIFVEIDAEQYVASQIEAYATQESLAYLREPSSQPATRVIRPACSTGLASAMKGSV